MPKDNYPLHPGQTHVQPLYTQIPLEEYEHIMSENRALKQANKNLTESVAELEQMKQKEVELDMRERELTRNGWHRMDEELPGVDEYVICYGGDTWNGRGYSMLKIATMKGPFGCPLWTDGSGKPICTDEITHWMYLPTPPESFEEKLKKAFSRPV